MTERFDFADYDANRGKYELFRSAQVKQTFTENGANDTSEGEYVNVRFVSHMPACSFYRRTVPLYEVTRANGHSFRCFGPCLYSFVL
jgi:hypothetical protein